MPVVITSGIFILPVMYVEHVVFSVIIISSMVFQAVSWIKKYAVYGGLIVSISNLVDFDCVIKWNFKIGSYFLSSNII